MINVLIAEDNPPYRGMLHRLLSGRFPFMQITETADGADALHQALSRHYDLIFMDIRLPQGNGLDLTRAIKAVCVDSLVCVTTGFDLPEYREAAHRQGADRFLVKSDSSSDEIVAIVQSLLASRFKTLVLGGDALSRRRLTMLLSTHWPAMVVADAADVRVGLDRADALKPDLVLLDLELPGSALAEVVRALRARSAHAKLIGMTDDDSRPADSSAMACGVDYSVPLEPGGHTGLVAIVDALQRVFPHH